MEQLSHSLEYKLQVTNKRVMFASVILVSVKCNQYSTQSHLNKANVDWRILFLSTKALQIFFRLSCSQRSRWQCNTATWLSRFWVSVDLRYVFSLLSDEKVRSAVQVVTGIVRNNCNSLTNSGNNLRHSVFSINMFTTSFMQVTLGDSSIDRPARL